MTSSSTTALVDILYLSDDNGINSTSTVKFNTNCSRNSIPQIPLICIVDKPHDLRIDGCESDTLEKRVISTLKMTDNCPKWDKIRHCHQLDRTTSGVMIYALNKTGAREISKLFMHRKITKIYLALVHGHIQVGKYSANNNSFLIDFPLQFIKNQRKETVMKLDDMNGEMKSRSAITQIIVKSRGIILSAIEIIPVSLLEIHLHTGRRHQIRVHLSEIGHPIIGDPIYSNDHKMNFNRMFLDAHCISFQLNGKHIEVQTKADVTFANAIKIVEEKEENVDDQLLLFPDSHSSEIYFYSLMIPFIIDQKNGIQILLKRGKMRMNDKRKVRSMIKRQQCWTFASECHLKDGDADCAQSIAQSLMKHYSELFGNHLYKYSTFNCFPNCNQNESESGFLTDVKNVNDVRFICHHLASVIRRGYPYHISFACKPYMIYFVPFKEDIIHSFDNNNANHLMWKCISMNQLLLTLQSWKCQSLSLDALLHSLLERMKLLKISEKSILDLHSNYGYFLNRNCFYIDMEDHEKVEAISRPNTTKMNFMNKNVNSIH